MLPLTEQGAIEGAASLLGSWLLGPGAHTEVDSRFGDDGVGDGGIDARLRVGDHEFYVEVKTRLSRDALDGAARRLSRVASGSGIPLLVVPFMSEQGRRRCEQEGIAWLDLSGNADVRAPGLRLLIDGKPNRFKRPGRVSSAFAPKGARVARYLLQEPRRYHSQAEIVERSRLSAGHVSKVLAKLLAEGLVERSDEGAVSVADPDRLLNAWADEYDFGQHERKRYVLASRNGQETTERLAEGFEHRGVVHMATGLCAAYLLDSFANFRITTMYLKAIPEAAVLAELGLREAERGENVWLVEPNDEGVFEGAKPIGGILSAHPVQVYLDLLGHPERAQEAAEHLRKYRLNWGSSDGR